MRKLLHHPKVIAKLRPLKPFYKRVFGGGPPNLPAVEPGKILRNLGGRAVFLFSFGRSGTTVFCDLLNSHPDIVSFGELLNQDAFHSYFKVLNSSAGRHLGCYPSTMESGFYTYVADLAARSGRRHSIFDMKFESLHLIEGNWRMPGVEFKLFEYLQDSGNPVILLERRDLVARYLSREVAERRNQFHSFQASKGGRLEPFPVDIACLHREVVTVRQQIAWVTERFADYERFLHVAYEDLFEPTARGGESQFSVALADRIAGFLGVENRFDIAPQLQKVSKTPLQDYVINHDEVEAFRERIASVPESAG
jgi:hypothetical protein